VSVKLPPVTVVTSVRDAQEELASCFEAFSQVSISVEVELAELKEFVDVTVQVQVLAL